MATARLHHSRPPYVGGQGNAQFRVARSVVIVPTVVVMVPIAVMIPVVVPVVIDLLHAFAVATAPMSLGRHDGGSERTRRNAEPHQCRCHRAQYKSAHFLLSFDISSDRFRAERLRTWGRATAATGPIGEDLMAAHETLDTWRAPAA